MPRDIFRKCKEWDDSLITRKNQIEEGKTEDGEGMGDYVSMLNFREKSLAELLKVVAIRLDLKNFIGSHLNDEQISTALSLFKEFDTIQTKELKEMIEGDDDFQESYKKRKDLAKERGIKIFDTNSIV